MTLRGAEDSIEQNSKAYFSKSDIMRVPLMRIRYTAIDMNKWTLSVWRQLTHTRVGCYAISAAMWRYDAGWRAKYFRSNPIFCYANLCNLLSHKNATIRLQQNWLYIDFQFCKFIRSSTVDLELRKKLVKCYIWSIALYGAETWTLRAVDQKHLETFEMWCWRRTEKIIWTDHVRNEEVLLRVK